MANFFWLMACIQEEHVPLPSEPRAGPDAIIKPFPSSDFGMIKLKSFLFIFC